MLYLIGHNGFNRTFMELKLDSARFMLRTSSFQSYLYGIEIVMPDLSTNLHCKFQSYLYGIEIGVIHRKKTNRRKFQSYLYGIEIHDGVRCKNASYGFNRTFMELKFVSNCKDRIADSRFQSYLYGIEIRSKS